MENILSSLNEEQKKAVIETEGPLIILAGAGSGKTRVLVYKVLYLILEKRVNPEKILMSTFTNKAAGEMLDRIQKILHEHGILGKPIVGTFHSLCAKIVRRDGYHIGISNRFRIYDEQDQQEVVKQALNLLDISGKQIRPRALLATISSVKNQMIEPEGYNIIASGYFQETVAKVYPLYQKLLYEQDALDFDDLLLKTIKLFKTNPAVLEIYQEKFQYILVDEYQDTNHAQYALTKLLGGKSQNICIVGDFSQSIYSFRGADFRNLEKFKQDFPKTKTFSLSQNYRSTQKILDAATSVITKNTTHPVLSLWTEKEEGEDIIIFQSENEHQEAEFIIQKVVEETARNTRFSLSDVAVLYRMNAQSRTLEEVFLHHGVPYVLVGGTRFYERREIKDVLAFLAALANPKNTVSLKRIEKIGKKKLEKFLGYAKKFHEGDFLESKMTIEILDEVIRETSYLSLYDESDPEDRTRLENIAELRSVAIEFPNPIQFLENVALVEQEYPSTALRASMPDRLSNGEKPDAITLMTLHGAKGLEFKMVFMIGMEEGIFPHSQSFFDQSDLEEERRLCYVGITRAKEKLFLTYAKRRLFFGQRVSPTVSRFILEFPEDVLKRNLGAIAGDEPEYL